MKYRSLLCLLLYVALGISSCGKKFSADEQAYIASIEQSRKEKDVFMKNDPSSPFHQDSTAQFHPLRYFDVDPELVFKSVLHTHPQQDTVVVLGTKGEERKSVRYGYLLWNIQGRTMNIQVYKNVSSRGTEYFSIWFTDCTTGKETYGVGRYLDFELDPDSTHLYTIDFNTAYNPWCAYSAQYSCAIPTADDKLDIAIEAGEKKFHE